MFRFQLSIVSGSVTTVDPRQRVVVWKIIVRFWWNGQDASRSSWRHQTISRTLSGNQRGRLPEKYFYIPQVGDYIFLTNNCLIFRRIFPLCSNTAGDAINKKVLEYWHQGLKREDILYQDLEELITLSAYNEKGKRDEVFSNCIVATSWVVRSKWSLLLKVDCGTVPSSRVTPSAHSSHFSRSSDRTSNTASTTSCDANISMWRQRRKTKSPTSLHTSQLTSNSFQNQDAKRYRRKLTSIAKYWKNEMSFRLLPRRLLQYCLQI